jgi:hypothetical protein
VKSQIVQKETTTMKRSDFELGEEILDVVHPRGRSHGMVLSVRLGPEEAERLYEASASSERKMSEIVRAALRAYLSPGQADAGEPVVNVTVTAEAPAILTIRGHEPVRQVTFAPPNWCMATPEKLGDAS